ncbi:hypothetical protein E3O42_15185 [Cryobacterium adonitolivorans]|uniref:Uncharacterized protein n=1 Tax=Cryobacterium adonitolivorans TaxID=1259189 RepID=A0A4R8VYR3_9MICO|nr:hypothetical protein E3O42_15185 [Cryobacterium adonitolivorans]
MPARVHPGAHQLGVEPRGEHRGLQHDAVGLAWIDAHHHSGSDVHGAQSDRRPRSAVGPIQGGAGVTSAQCRGGVVRCFRRASDCFGDWIVDPSVWAGGRIPPEARHQQVLDLGHPGADTHVLGQVDAILTEYGIRYIKWDHNRVHALSFRAITALFGHAGIEWDITEATPAERAAHGSGGAGRADRPGEPRREPAGVGDCAAQTTRRGPCWVSRSWATPTSSSKSRRSPRCSTSTSSTERR